ncbi:unnamed protein product [Brassica oleracea]|uniref:(rape) hypothetical protein n=1 Tax=Brassica napus TaxID=3708 RepID=A0A816J5L2_BRANA|nr:unnamed protein product [Brassica napus]
MMVAYTVTGEKGKKTHIQKRKKKQAKTKYIKENTYLTRRTTHTLKINGTHNGERDGQRTTRTSTSRETNTRESDKHCIQIQWI